MKDNVHAPIGANKATMAGVLHRWGPGKLWAILNEDLDLDLFVRAETEADALTRARAWGCDGDLIASEQDESTRDAIHDRLLFAKDDIGLLLATVNRLSAQVGAQTDEFGGTHCPRCRTVDGNGLKPGCPVCGWVPA